MSRSTLRLIGFSLLIPSVLLGLLPLIAAHSDIASTWHSFTFTLGNLRVMKYSAASQGTGLTVNPLIWAVAAIGEFFLIAGHFARPSRKNRYTLSLN